VHAWRDWLAVSNVLQFLAPGRFHAHTGTTAALPVTGTEPAGSLIGPWRDVHEVSDHAVQGLVTVLTPEEYPSRSRATR
jgi:hypothetical protein